MQQIVLALLGLIVGGAVTSTLSGGLSGGVLGFLLGHAWSLTIRTKNLENELKSIRSTLVQQVPPVQASTTSSEPPSDRSSAFENHSETAHDSQPFLAESEQQNDLTTDQIFANAEFYDQDSEPATDHKTARPSLLKRAIDQVKRFFTKGNPIVRVGMLILFFGLSFLAKYASSAGLFPIELRLSVIALVATALLVIGWITRQRHHGYGLILQGGGVAALYLTVFAAAKFYALMPASIAFVLMTIIVVFGVMLAVLQNAQVLALMAAVGGFLVPILTSDGSGSHVGLFSFYLLLNLGILAIAWFKSWRLLNWIGFVFTFAITSLWSANSYDPENYYSTQPFLIAFFLLYLAVSVLFSLKQPPKLTGIVDGSLVFGLPVIAFGLQTLLLQETDYGLPVSALILAALYLGLASVLFKRYGQTQRVLSESFIALGVIFITLSVPLALDASWTSATWCIEAAGLVWIGARQQRWLARVAGYLLYIAGIAALMSASGRVFHKALDDPEYLVLSFVIFALAALVTAFILQRFSDVLSRLEKGLEKLYVLLGTAWWYSAGSLELVNRLPSDDIFAGIIAFVSLTALALIILSRRLHWPNLFSMAYSLLPLVALWGILAGLIYLRDPIHEDGLHPFQRFGVVAIALFVAVQYLLLWFKRHEPSATETSERTMGLTQSWHVLTVWLLLASAMWELHWYQEALQWRELTVLLSWFALLAMPIVVLMLLLKRSVWPFGQYEHVYRHIVPIPLLLMLLGWFLLASLHSGATPMLHLPILNPLDMAQLALVVLLGYACQRDLMGLRRMGRGVYVALPAIIGFIWLNLVLLRSIHVFCDVPYNGLALWNSGVVQMALSILWSLCALIIMNSARRIQSRKVWLMGVSVLGIVLLKLFTVDLNDSDNLTRIVSFMVVGALMLLIGYLSPIPSREQADAAFKLKEDNA